MFGVESTFTSPSTWSGCGSSRILKNWTPLTVNVLFPAPTVRPFTFARPAGPVATTFPMLPKFVPPKAVTASCLIGFMAWNSKPSSRCFARLISMIAASTYTSPSDVDLLDHVLDGLVIDRRADNNERVGRLVGGYRNGPLEYRGRPAGLLSASRNGGGPCQERRYYLRGVLGVRVLEIVNIDLALALRRGNVEGAQKALDLFYVMHRIGDDEGVGNSLIIT